MFDCQDHAGGQQGFTIVEALVAFIILASGLLALLSFHGAVQRNNAEARTQAEAVALAEQKLNELASFLSADDTRLSQVSVGACPGEESTGSGVASFAFRCDMSGANPRDVRVTVSWQDRDDNPRQAVVDSKVRVSEPGRDAAGLLTLVRAAVTADEAGALWLVAEAGDGEGQDGEDGSTEESDGEESSGEEGSGS
ncbi:MAG: prepilin-type N-terminal cleavage/methylation domain-containing protein, partial [Bacteroidales bacterium]|nr:prepilin-type N-terminal cleavage/methylation domain-containing protein [Bacteroidales bacterium]